MAADTDKIKILEEKIKALDDKNADGNLTIKVSKRDQALPGGVFRSALVCTLTGGTIAHIINPEIWLPRLMGGGRYILAVYPPGMSGSVLVDGIEVDLSGEPKNYPDFEAVEESSWAGPRQIAYPTKRALQQAQQPALSIMSPPGAGFPTPSTSAPQMQASPGTGGPNPGAAHQEELRQLREFYANQVETLNRQLAEEKHRREMDDLKTTQQRQMEAMRAEMRDLATKLVAPPPPVPQPSQSIGEVIKEVLPLAMPLVTTWLTSSAERERRAEERQNEVIRALSVRPAIPPEIKEIMDAQRAEQLPVMAVLQQSASATAAMASQMFSMAREVAEMQSGPEESAPIKAIREVGSALQGIISASATPAPAKQRRLPKIEQAPPSAAPPAQTQAMGDASSPTLNSLDRIKAMLTAQEDPDKVAQEAVKAFPTPEFQKALADAKFEPRIMFQNLMTEQWLVANFEYVTAFGKAFTHRGQLAGIFEADGEEEGEEDAA